VRAQLDTGIELVSDGQTRGGMIEIFTNGLRGFRTKKRIEIVNEIEFKKPIILSDQHLTKEILPENVGLKGILTGPVTLIESCDDLYYQDTKDAVLDSAEALHEEAKHLADICDVIQMDEPFLSNHFPEYAQDAVETVLDIDIPTALHVCGDIRDNIGNLIEFDVDILDHEFASNPGLYEAYEEVDMEQKMAVGVVTTSPPAEEVNVIKKRIDKAIKVFETDIMIDPDCGLRNLDEETAWNKLKNLVMARDVVLNERG
ncbi:MAG: methionine synthase, partial [Candidatus Saliniplasma sp.]